MKDLLHYSCFVMPAFIFSERCENPENFEDYDICGGITADMCDEPDYVDMFAEFCPTVCSCSKYSIIRKY